MRLIFNIIIITSLINFNIYAAELGDDGLHKEPWFSYTFKDITEDINTAASEQKNLVLIFEQRGCIYCAQMHETVFTDPEIIRYIENHFMFVQYNMDGSEEVIDTDGEALEERDAFMKWGLFATPTMIFMPRTLESTDKTAVENALQVVPGAFGKWTTLNMLKWIHEEAYKETPNFQKYHADKLNQAREQGLL